MVFVTDDHEGIFMYGTTNQAGSMDMNFVGICLTKVLSYAHVLQNKM